MASASLSGHGNVLVDASTGRTLYQFAQDTANSGTSACTAACISTWPPLIVPGGTSPSAPDVGGQWGTITRPDGGGRQVTDNGLPLYTFSGDAKAGDANGNYPGWSVVAVTGAPSASQAAGGGAAAPTPTATPYSHY